MSASWPDCSFTIPAHVSNLSRRFVLCGNIKINFILNFTQVIKSVDIDNSGNLSFAEFLMLMVKTEGVEGVKLAFQSYDTGLKKVFGSF